MQGATLRTTPVKNFPKKITMEMILIHSNHRRLESRMALEEEHIFIYLFIYLNQAEDNLYDFS